MFTLIILALGMAAIAASFLSTSTSPITVEQALPAGVLALSWRRVSEIRTRNGLRTLWTGEGETAAFARAYSADRDGMRSAGFSWDNNTPVCWEAVPAPEDADVLAAVAAAESAADAIEAGKAAARIAAVQQADRDWLAHRAERERAIARLKACLDGQPWAWTKRKQEWAVSLLKDRPSERDARLADELVDEVEFMIAEVIKRLGAVRIEEWWDRAGDEGVRAAVLQACRLLSGLDEDRAAIRNNIGWSAAHSHTGHVVASLPELDQTQASHALRAVWAHRRQIGAELRAAIFGSAGV